MDTSSPGSDPPLLTVDNLVHTLNGTKLFAGLTLAVLPGRIHFIMGPNGSGKTKLLRTIADLEPASERSVSRLRGISVFFASPEMWSAWRSLPVDQLVRSVASHQQQPPEIAPLLRDLVFQTANESTTCLTANVRV